MTWILLSGILLIPLTAISCFGFSRWMRARLLGQQIRDVGPQSHASKAGTPTMGGIIVLLLWASTVIIFGITTGWSSTSGFVLASGLGFGGLGLADDVLSIRNKHSIGLTAVQKIALGSAISIGLFSIFRDQVVVPQQVPFANIRISLPWIAAFFLSWVLFLASTNSANLTDGLDGLAGGVSILVLGGFLVMYPSTENLILILPLIGALAGFLWLNAHPASLFLGDVGSFALGGVVGALALANGAAFLLPILAGVFVLEAASVILQVGILRLTGKRLFKMSPLHHHFENSPNRGATHWLPAFEWPESKVTARFLLLQAGFVILAIWAAGIYW
ncbi:phospho-N-acetylmuramoyl-pentapeptide-transferase [Candidatus Bipolaricaulota bacterium]|nr:phospho-N-acetylmuramoyl-pentapeptide-transferase [Candidatus Bipolaricaulota bacterium]